MVGENIRTIRKSKKMSINKLSELSGVSLGFLSDIENGKTNPSIDTLEKISDALKVEIKEFFESEPISKEKLEQWKEEYNKNDKLTEQAKYIESIKLDSAEEALKFILQQPSLMAFGGYDLNDMSEEEIMDLANDMLFAMKLSLEKHRRK